MSPPLLPALPEALPSRAELRARVVLAMADMSTEDLALIAVLAERMVPPPVVRGEAKR